MTPVAVAMTPKSSCLTPKERQWTTASMLAAQFGKGGLAEPCGLEGQIAGVLQSAAAEVSPKPPVTALVRLMASVVMARLAAAARALISRIVGSIGGVASAETTLIARPSGQVGRVLADVDEPWFGGCPWRFGGRALR